MADLTAAAAWQGPQGAARNGRALSALKHMTAGLRNKRIVVEASQEATGPGRLPSEHAEHAEHAAASNVRPARQAHRGGGLPGGDWPRQAPPLKHAEPAEAS